MQHQVRLLTVVTAQQVFVSVSKSIPTESVFIDYYLDLAYSKDNKASIYTSCRDNTYKFISIFQNIP